jgi:hypothetical protein
MRVVRDQLYRASLGVQALPHTSNWPREAKHFGGDENPTAQNEDLPVWADVSHSTIDASTAATDALSHFKTADLTKQQKDTGSTVISDLSKMSEEVGSLLEAIEINLYQQRNRRLDKLRPPSRLRRNWYMFLVAIPTALYIGHKLTKEHGGKILCNDICLKIVSTNSKSCSCCFRLLSAETGHFQNSCHLPRSCIRASACYLPGASQRQS